MVRRLSTLVLALVMLTASGCSLLNTVNELPGTIGGKPSKPAQVDYSKPESMRAAMAAFETALKGDDKVFQAVFDRDHAAVWTLTQRLQIIDGVISEEPTQLLPVTDNGVPLSTFDPAAAIERLGPAAAARGCTDASGVTFILSAALTVITDVSCTLNGEQVRLVEGPDGALLPDVDLTTKDGMARALADVASVTDKGATRYTVFGFMYDGPSGIPYLLTNTGRISTTRQAAASSWAPILFQDNTNVEEQARAFDVSGIGADTYWKVYQAAKAKCGTVTLLALMVADDGSTLIQSGNLGCPYRTDRTGKPV